MPNPSQPGAVGAGNPPSGTRMPNPSGRPRWIIAKRDIPVVNHSEY